ncbi:MULTISPECIES: hypothetical protein [unclassified Caballeronia]|uniref:hypothetical protein n=1 Tax=unclassified Caballeronia TaxID=2646786 RepID=UPI0028582837|nr:MULTISPECIES: hypothetical protein [unclassified Caballeronia]MDR5741038.1 hypothetical protein [Caballeronia sp. LZ016]MDR5806936.1 hypothetical protein [Caballeronia sp. LZ019]
METLLFFAVIGALAGAPVWIVWQRRSARRGLIAARHFDPRDAAPCRIEAVALNGRLLPEADAVRPEDKA